LRQENPKQARKAPHNFQPAQVHHFHRRLYFTKKKQFNHQRSRREGKKISWKNTTVHKPNFNWEQMKQAQQIQTLQL
jgi:hypothetical protein